MAKIKMKGKAAPLRNEEYERVKQGLRPYIESKGPMVALIAVMDVAMSLGLEQMAAEIERCCGNLGIGFATQYIPSSSGGDPHVVTMTPDGILICDCMGWRYSTIPNKFKQDQKSCNHTRKAEANPDAWKSIVTIPEAATMQAMQESRTKSMLAAASTTSPAKRPMRKIIFGKDDD